VTCPSGESGAPACTASSARGEVCDGKDNDCNGAIDDIKTHHDVPINDQMFEDGSGVFGQSYNRLFGPADCGGDRKSAAATKLEGGDSNCGVVDWADVACANPKAKIGNSTLEDACKVFTQQGGQVGNNAHDCRYIVHVGIKVPNNIRCQPSHVVTVADHCP
jgi:hypothetical protein